MAGWDFCSVIISNVDIMGKVTYENKLNCLKSAFKSRKRRPNSRTMVSYHGIVSIYCRENASKCVKSEPRVVFRMRSQSHALLPSHGGFCERPRPVSTCSRRAVPSFPLRGATLFRSSLHRWLSSWYLMIPHQLFPSDRLARTMT